jgi:DNA polymerase-3 subunit epsilon
MRLGEVDFVVVDVEATGGSPVRGDRVTEVAAVRVQGGCVVECFETLVNPERPIPPTFSALTNITEEMVAGAPRFREVAEPLREALEGAVFVAHNAGFDWRFIHAEFERCTGARLGGERLCTLRMARRIHPELSRRSLRVLADYYSISAETWHRAGADARTTAELFIRFLHRLGEEGVESWGGLQEFLKPRPRKRKRGSRKRIIN